MESTQPGAEPVANSAFAPGPNAAAAPDFTGAVQIQQTPMRTKPELLHPMQDGRDARLFPGLTLELFTMHGLLVPAHRGEMIRETVTVKVPSYWRVIPQFGRVWKEPADGRWSRAALPIMIVNDTENHAHQGLATFLYDGSKVTNVRFQFIQQTAPYLLHQHHIAWGTAPAILTPWAPPDLAAARAQAEKELADRLPTRPWSELVKSAPPGTLDGFGGPLDPRWMVTAALVRDGIMYYQNAPTPYGDYPYPLEMRFGVRSITKSVVNPLALLHLAQVYGPWILTLKVGDYVDGLDPKWKRVRFMDAMNMASGFGGVGSIVTNPNDGESGYLEGDYDGWYTAPSHEEKLRVINANLRPYPWEPGTVWRYRDQDLYLLGVAIDHFIKSVRGPQADQWAMVQEEVFKPIGVYHAPSVHTREPGEKDGYVWGNAGYYPTLDDLAKIATLYRDLGEHNGQQILNRALTADLMAAKDAMRKKTDMSVDRSRPPEDSDEELYKLGFHFAPYIGSKSHKRFYLPEMLGSGENQVIIFPNGLVSIRAAKAAELPKGEKANSGVGEMTAEAVDRLLPF
jgi:CubicO group peptidase (beta-lactamase class C family)